MAVVSWHVAKRTPSSVEGEYESDDNLRKVRGLRSIHWKIWDLSGFVTWCKSGYVTLIKIVYFYLLSLISVDSTAPEHDCWRYSWAVNSQWQPSILSTSTCAYWLGSFDRDMSPDDCSRHHEISACMAHNYVFFPNDEQRVQSPPSTGWGRESQWGLRPDVLSTYSLRWVFLDNVWMHKEALWHYSVRCQMLMLTRSSNSVIMSRFVVDAKVKQLLILLVDFYLVIFEPCGARFNITLRWIHIGWNLRNALHIQRCRLITGLRICRWDFTLSSFLLQQSTSPARYRIWKAAVNLKRET